MGYYVEQREEEKLLRDFVPIPTHGTQAGWKKPCSALTSVLATASMTRRPCSLFASQGWHSDPWLGSGSLCKRFEPCAREVSS